jgi:hypothetical protein
MSSDMCNEEWQVCKDYRAFWTFESHVIEYVGFACMLIELFHIVESPAMLATRKVALEPLVQVFLVSNWRAIY